MLNEVLLKMKDIEYGYLYQGEDISETEDLAKYYTLNSPEKTIKDKMGVCWDQVELERKYFNELKEILLTELKTEFRPEILEDLKKKWSLDEEDVNKEADNA